ncbi:DUF1015 domain-containing protein [bacterium]|nr:DUF1015 domain-containing protein [bacterium]
MITLRPLRALRPAPAVAEKLVSLPYDVLDSDEAREKSRGNPYSFFHISKPEIDLNPSVDPHSSEVYAKGRENFDRFIREKTLIQEKKPCFYVYRLILNGHIQTGLLACVSIGDYEAGRVKKHEHTRVDKEDDRLRHILTLNAQTGPVFLMYRHRDEIQSLIEAQTSSQPLYDIVKEYGIRHILYRIEDAETIGKLAGLFRELDALYIADGHHRSAAGLRAGLERRKSNPKHTGEEEYNFLLAVIFPHTQLRILDYNRAVKDLAGRSPEDFLRAAGERFDVIPHTAAPGTERAFHPPGPTQFGMYLDGSWYRLSAKPGFFNAADPIDSLDVSILQNNLLSPVLGIGDPRTDKRIHFIGGIRGLQELERLVDDGRYRAAFSMHPTVIDQLLAVADADRVMPPKSTWFEPKLGSGLIVHWLED